MAVRFEPSTASSERADKEPIAVVTDFRSRKKLGRAELGSSSSKAADLNSDLGEPEKSVALTPSEIEDRALSKLARKALSEREIRGIMISDGADESVAEDLLEEFRRKGYVDDLKLAEDLVESLMRRKKQGPAVIRRELSQRGIQESAMREALDEVDEDDELRLVIDAAEDRIRRMGTLTRTVAERRLTGYLQRRGYNAGHIRIAVDKALGGESSGGHGGGSSVKFR